MIKTVCEGEHCSDSDQVKEGKSLGLDCAVIKDVEDVLNLASSKTHALFG